MIVVYIAGPYRASTPWEVERNIRRAEELAYEVASLGCVPVCPHSMYRFFDRTLTDRAWLDICMELLERCDALLTVPGWEHSAGSRAEVDRLVGEDRKFVFHDLGKFMDWAHRVRAEDAMLEARHKKEKAKGTT
jgi:hypothetical protein